MALSMDEQRILDGMERRLADDDPRLASRLSAFGRPRFLPALGSGKARAAVVLISLALAAIVTLMVYSMRPFPAGSGRQTHQTPRAASSSSGRSSVSPAISKPASPTS
jgi:hypothetical protein